MRQLDSGQWWRHDHRFITGLHSESNAFGTTSL